VDIMAPPEPILDIVDPISWRPFRTAEPGGEGGLNI